MRTIFLLVIFSIFWGEKLFCEKSPSSLLSLNDAVLQALERSPELAKASLELATQKLQEPMLLSETDPSFFAAYSKTKDKSPRDVPAIQGTESSLDVSEVAVIQKTLLGTEARLSWKNDKLVNPSAFRPIDPTVNSHLSMNIQQPLLRYFWGRPDKARRSFFRAQVRVMEGVYHKMKDEIISKVIQSYLEFLYAIERIKIVEESLATAVRFFSLNKEKRRYGLVEESALLQSEVAVEVQETELILAQSALEQVRNNFYAALSYREEEIKPITVHDPEPISLNTHSLKEAFERGLLLRGDLKSAIAAVETAEWAKRIKVLDTLPEVYLSGAYGFSGLASAYSDSWDDLQGWDHRVTSVGLSLQIPFFARKEKLNRQTAAIRLSVAQKDLEKTKRDSSREIRNAWENYLVTQKKFKATQKLLDLEKKKLKAEEKNFKRGRSSTDLVVRFQQDLQNARSQFLRTRIDLYLSKVELKRTMGSLTDGF